jgi:hypothetical protein
MRGFGCWINRLVRFESQASDVMSLREKMKTKIRAVRDPDSLDIVEQVMEEEERLTKNTLEPGSPDWLRLANIALVVMLVLFLLLAWNIR